MIILLGVTGSGKSLQGRLLADECGYAWISSGKVLRVLLSGEKRQKILSGKLLDDDEMIQIISKIFELVDPKQQMILDGFPRTLTQVDWLIQRAKAGDFELATIFNFEVSQTVVKDRLIKRRRVDDTAAAIQKRFEEYSSATLPIIERFRNEGYRIVNINAADNPQAIHKYMVSVINEESDRT
jgi:adenylate kinase